MKKINYLIFIILLFISFEVVNAYNFDNTSKVYDYALVLTDKQSDKLKTSVSRFINKYNIDMVLVTVRHYNYSDLKDYSKAFYEKNNFGLDVNKSGIIMVVDLKNNITVLNTFGDANKLYDNIEIKNMTKRINEKNKVYDKFTKFIKYSNKYIKQNNTIFDSYDIFYSIDWFVLSVCSSILPTIIVVTILLQARKTNKKNNDNSIEYYIENCNIEIHKRREKFITTNTKQIYK